jgi:hypothetical protein
MADAGAASDAHDMLPWSATFPLLVPPDQFTRITAALVVLAVALTLLVVVAMLATEATTDTKKRAT